MTEKNKLFIPIDGVIVKIEKETNTAGIEMPDSLKKKNEGVIVSDGLIITQRMRKQIWELEVRKSEILVKNNKIKFTEGYELEDDLLFVKIDKIIGIYK